MASKTFEPPPTYADPVIVDETSGKSKFNPIWLKWFVDAAGFFTNPEGQTDHEKLQNLFGVLSGQHWHVRQADLTNLLAGLTTTVVLAKLTGGGANGSLTVQGGIITAYTPPT